MAQEQQEGIVLGTMGKATYIRVDYVFELDQRGRWTPYCPSAAWEESEAAIEARRLARIAELEAELARLKAKPAAPAAASKQVQCENCGKEFVVGRGIAVHEAKCPGCRLAEAEANITTPLEAASLASCKYCGKEFNAGRGVAVHESKCLHRNRKMLTAPLATLPPASPAIVALESEWRCAECNATTFAADIKEPARCVRCTGAYTAALSRAS